MFNKLKSFIALLIIKSCVFCIPQGLQAQVDPDIEWKEIETDSAYWIFDAKQRSVAEHYILQFERAKEQVYPLFKEIPRKMTVLLIDNTDLANGSAMVTPRPIVTLFTVSPSGNSSIGEFKDHIHELLTHEYTHILNMEPTNGWMSPLYWIFGSVAHPNMILPRWYTEGLAVYTESLLSNNGGRLNSQYLEGLARALTLEKRWNQFPLSDLNDNHLDWLSGSRAYLFGGILWDSIAREKGIDVLYKFNQSYSRRIPYLLDGVIETHVGNDYETQLKKAYDFWQMRAQKQIDIVKSKPQLNGDLVNFTEGYLSSPRVSPDGASMAFLASDNEGFGHVYLTPRNPQKGFRGSKPERVLAKTQTQTLVWNPAATGFLYEKIDIRNIYNRYYDLYFYDLQSKKSKRITKGARSHHACFSPDGKVLYFLENTPSGKKIVGMDWSTQAKESLYQSPIGDDLRYLSCPDASTLLFVEHFPGKDAHIAKLDLPSKTKSIRFEKYPINFLKMTQKGPLFSSAESGIENLYLLENEQGPKAITNSVTRVMDGDLDPLDDSLYLTQLTGDGAKLFSLEKKQWEGLPATPPKVEPIVDWEYAKADRQHLLARGPAEQSSLLQKKERDFSPWRYLYPNYWIPFLYVVDGGTIYQAQTAFGDPLGINSVSVTGQWDTLTEKPGVSASYINNSLPVSLGVGVSDVHNYFYSNRTTLHYTNGSFLMGYRLRFMDNTRVLFKWNYSSLDTNNNVFVRQGPQLELSYGHTKQNNNDISPSSGWRGQLGHKNFLADAGNISYGETYAHVGTFWSSFTPKRHVFYLGLNGSYAPQLPRLIFGSTTLAGPFFNPQIVNTSFLQRGYPTGLFIGNNIINANAEYRFPLLSVFKGFYEPPVFLKNLQGNFVFDATTLDGLYSSRNFRSSQFAEIGRVFTGYGFELESNINVGFHVPVSFVLGIYYGVERESYGGLTTFFNVRL